MENGFRDFSHLSFWNVCTELVFRDGLVNLLALFLGRYQLATRAGRSPFPRQKVGPPLAFAFSYPLPGIGSAAGDPKKLSSFAESRTYFLPITVIILIALLDPFLVSSFLKPGFLAHVPFRFDRDFFSYKSDSFE